MIALVGDFGGTNLRLGLAEDGAVTRPWSKSCSEFRSPQEAIADYLRLTGATPDLAVLAVTGPIIDGVAAQANNGWRFSETELAAAGIGKVVLVNDFAALALAIPHLSSKQSVPIGEPIAGRDGSPLAIIGPGTGLGIAALLRTATGDVPLAGEGGHMGFAPFDAVEVEIAARLASGGERVSLETILSGAGLARLHATLADIEGRPTPPLDAAQVVEKALAGDARCRATLERFWLILASAAGDVVLLFGATGGVFIGGGVALRSAPLIDHGRFRQRFCAKGSRRTYLEATPSRLITDSMAALTGAAQMALRC